MNDEAPLTKRAGALQPGDVIKTEPMWCRVKHARQIGSKMHIVLENAPIIPDADHYYEVLPR